LLGLAILTAYLLVDFTRQASAVSRNNSQLSEAVNRAKIPYSGSNLVLQFSAASLCMLDPKPISSPEFHQAIEADVEHK